MITIKNLTKAYGKQRILTRTNFQFPDSGLVCILGASGCGKSTLLNMIAGFDGDYSGEITVHGVSISRMNTNERCAYRRDNIGFVFQNHMLISGYTGLENIMLASELNHASKGKNRERAAVLLELLNMGGKANKNVENLSGGEKQRIAIARALINAPSILLADEPTGALDLKNAKEIMTLLKRIAAKRLVLVITHDPKICAFADQVITIKDEKIVGKDAENLGDSRQKLKKKSEAKTAAFQRGLKNFKVYRVWYTGIALMIAIGMLAFMLALSSGNILEKSIVDFKEKNTAFNNGYVKTEDNADEVVARLEKDQDVERVYKQYILEHITLSVGEKSETMVSKYPMPKATEAMSYGTMPKIGKDQIALTPSLAKKFDREINQLVGKELIINQGKTNDTLTISGIYNAGYDDFFVSNDIEQKFYEPLKDKKPYAVSYDVKTFEAVVSVAQMLEQAGINAKTAAEEVSALQKTFENLNRLFLITALLILGIGLLISTILLVKLQNSRIREIGLLSALGFSKNKIRRIIMNENLFLSIMAILFNALLMGMVYGLSIMFKWSLIFTIPQILVSLFGTGFVIILIGISAGHRLVQTEPASALRN